MSDTVTPRATFTAMTEGTQEDWQRSSPTRSSSSTPGLADRVIDPPAPARRRLRRLRGRPPHALAADRDARRTGPTATTSTSRARCSTTSATRSAPFNHADIAAAIVKPFVSEGNHWMVEQHGIFQGYYFFHSPRARPQPARPVHGPPVLRPHAPSSAPTTTSPRSIPTTRRCRSRSSSRCSASSSPRPKQLDLPLRLNGATS